MFIWILMAILLVVIVVGGYGGRRRYQNNRRGAETPGTPHSHHAKKNAHDHRGRGSH